MTAFTVEKVLVLFELSPGATFDEIKSSYRQLCMVWHPDRQPDSLRQRAENKLKELNAAFEWIAQNKDVLVAKSNYSSSQIKHEDENKFTNGEAGFCILGKSMAISTKYLKACLVHRQFRSTYLGIHQGFQDSFNSIHTITEMRDLIYDSMDGYKYPLARYAHSVLLAHKILDYSVEDVVEMASDDFISDYHEKVLDRFDSIRWGSRHSDEHNAGIIFQNCCDAFQKLSVSTYDVMQQILADNGLDVVPQEVVVKNKNKVDNILDNLDSSTLNVPSKIDTILKCISLNPGSPDAYQMLIYFADQAGAKDGDYAQLLQFINSHAPFVAELSENVQRVMKPSGQKVNQENLPKPNSKSQEPSPGEELDKAWQEFKDEVGKNPIVQGWKKLFGR